METTLQNPTSPGLGSTSYVDLIPPYTFSVSLGFGYVFVMRMLSDEEPSVILIYL